MRPSSLALVLLVSGCVRTATPAPLPECTLSTPLVPGVPGSPGHLIVTDLHPDGTSELALLMRGLVDDTKAARVAVLAGRQVPARWSVQRHLRCAWPTAAADRDARFDALAASYLEQVRTLEAQPADPRTAYTHVLEGCLACHQTMCPGPIDLIEGLRL
jgi:hypothetical protein